MSVWIEIHCDMPGDRKPGDEAFFPDGRGVGGSYHPERGCHSDHNANPSDMAGNGSVVTVFGAIKRSARASGWKLTKDGWICPSCQKWGKPSNA